MISTGKSYTIAIPTFFGAAVPVAIVDPKELPNGVPQVGLNYRHRFLRNTHARVVMATADHVWFDRIDESNKSFQVVGRINNFDSVYRVKFRSDASKAYENRCYWTVERFQRFFGAFPQTSGLDV
jgi:hypothetical protein